MADRLTHEEIEHWREREAGIDSRNLPAYRAYASGEQGQILSADQRKLITGKKQNPVADNVLRLVLSTAASRLEMEGWLVPDKATQNYLSEMYLTSRVARLQYDTHFAALRDGNTAVSLRWRSDASGPGGRVTIHREPWWDGESGVFIAYDDYDEPSWAVRDFIAYDGLQEVQRRVVYYPDMIQRFRFVEGGWKPYALPGDPETGPTSEGIIPWKKRDGDPIGLPVVSFSNSLADDGLYGRSDMFGLLGMQDDLNAIQNDITAAAAFTGYQMYWMAGVPVTDEKQKVGPGRTVKSENPSARFGTFPPGDMSSLTDAHGYKRSAMGVDTSTPMHLITGGDWPSGEALLRAEMPLVDKVKRLARVIGPSWILVAHRATEIANTFGGQSLNEESPITVVFAPPERLDEMTDLQVKMAKVNLYAALNGISDPVLLKATGLLSDEEITQITAGRVERAASFLTPVAEF